MYLKVLQLLHVCSMSCRPYFSMPWYPSRESSSLSASVLLPFDSKPLSHLFAVLGTQSHCKSASKAFWNKWLLRTECQKSQSIFSPSSADDDSFHLGDSDYSPGCVSHHMGIASAGLRHQHFERWPLLFGCSQWLLQEMHKNWFNMSSTRIWSRSWKLDMP